MNSTNQSPPTTSTTEDDQSLKHQQWIQIQNELKKKLSLQSSYNSPIHTVAGLDISFSKEEDNTAIASLVVLSYADCSQKKQSPKPIYKAFKTLKMTEPYIAGFLAFREVSVLQELWEEMRRLIAEGQIALSEEPQVALIDGNGIHHHRGFGLASHFGVLTNVPSIGVAKNFLCIDGLTMDDAKNLNATLKHAGDFAYVKGQSGVVWSAVLRGTDKAKNPVYVSAGHRVSLEDSIKIVSQCCLYKIPEPIRQADLLSRDEIRILDKSIASSNKTKNT